MKKALKWIGVILGSLIILAVVAAVVLSVVGTSRLNITVDIQAEPSSFPRMRRR